MTMKRMLLGCVLALATFFGLLEAAPPAGSPFISPLVARPASIAGHPFSAEEAVQLTMLAAKNPQPERSYKYYRDAMGRTLSLPARNPVYNPGLTEIVDPVAGYWYVLDASKQIAHRAKILGALQRPHLAPNPNSTSLGSQYLLGVQAEGQRTITPNGATIEIWICKDLQLPLIQRSSDSISTGLTQITNLHLGDPSPELFQIPSGYAVVDETTPFTVE